MFEGGGESNLIIVSMYLSTETPDAGFSISPVTQHYFFSEVNGPSATSSAMNMLCTKINSANN